MEDNFSTDGGWGVGGMVQAVMRAMGSDGERWGAAVDEVSLAHPPLTSCCVAWFLTGHARTDTGSQPGGCGSLHYTKING